MDPLDQGEGAANFFQPAFFFPASQLDPRGALKKLGVSQHMHKTLFVENSLAYSQNQELDFEVGKDGMQLSGAMARIYF